jgi:hypothetical protein
MIYKTFIYYDEHNFYYYKIIYYYKRKLNYLHQVQTEREHTHNQHVLISHTFFFVLRKVK